MARAARWADGLAGFDLAADAGRHRHGIPARSKRRGPRPDATGRPLLPDVVLVRARRRRARPGARLRLPLPAHLRRRRRARPWPGSRRRRRRRRVRDRLTATRRHRLRRGDPRRDDRRHRRPRTGPRTSSARADRLIRRTLPAQPCPGGKPVVALDAEVREPEPGAPKRSFFEVFVAIVAALALVVGLYAFGHALADGNDSTAWPRPAPRRRCRSRVAAACNGARAAVHSPRTRPPTRTTRPAAAVDDRGFALLANGEQHAHTFTQAIRPDGSGRAGAPAHARAPGRAAVPDGEGRRSGRAAPRRAVLARPRRALHQLRRRARGTPTAR